MQKHLILRMNHYLSEFIATFVFIFVGVTAIALFFGTEYFQSMAPSQEVRLLIVILIFAVTVSLIIYSPLGKISGAHFNPAVSFAFYIEAHLDTIDFIGYVVMQIVASIAGCFLVSLLLPYAGAAVQFGLTQPASQHDLYIIEFISETSATFLLVTVIFFCLNHEKTVKYTGAAVATYIFFVAVSIAELTGASLNPARSIGPAVIAGVYTHLWLYIVAPIFGTFLAVVLHRSWWALNRPKFHRLNHDETYLKLLFGRHPELKDDS